MGRNPGIRDFLQPCPSSNAQNRFLQSPGVFRSNPWMKAPAIRNELVQFGPPPILSINEGNQPGPRGPAIHRTTQGAHLPDGMGGSREKDPVQGFQFPIRRAAGVESALINKQSKSRIQIQKCICPRIQSYVFLSPSFSFVSGSQPISFLIRVLSLLRPRTPLGAPRLYFLFSFTPAIPSAMSTS